MKRLIIALLFIVPITIVCVMLFTTPRFQIWIHNIGKAQTNYTFLYTYDSDWNSTGVPTYVVKNDQVAYVGTSTSPAPKQLPLFDGKSEKTVRTFSLDEASRLKLSADPVSPDGFIFITEYQFCGTQNVSLYCPHSYLRHRSGEQREIVLPPLEFLGAAHFVGWVIQ